MILKRDYENKSALVGGAKFSAAEKDGTDEKHRYAFANLEPTAADRTEAPQTLEIGEKKYTLAKDRTYYTDGEYRYTYVITSYVERGKYAFAETTTRRAISKPRLRSPQACRGTRRQERS